MYLQSYVMLHVLDGHFLRKYYMYSCETGRTRKYMRPIQRKGIPRTSLVLYNLVNPIIRTVQERHMHGVYTT